MEVQESTPPTERHLSEPPRTPSDLLPSNVPTGGTRNSSHGSVLEVSSFSARLQTGHYVTHGVSPSADDFGLTLVHSCPEPLVDFIFVHGLGGTSRRSWSWQRDPRNFWPEWLGKEAELCKSRIFTFGYNADFSGRHTLLKILDFAKDLLFRMKTYSSAQIPHDQSIGRVSMEVPLYQAVETQHAL